MKMPTNIGQKKRPSVINFSIKCDTIKEAKNLRICFTQQFVKYYDIDKKNFTTELIKGDELI